MVVLAPFLYIFNTFGKDIIISGCYFSCSGFDGYRFALFGSYFSHKSTDGNIFTLD